MYNILTHAVTHIVRHQLTHFFIVSLTIKNYLMFYVPQIVIAAYHKYGKNWVKIAAHVTGRDSNTCRERFENALSEDLLFGKWTFKEDRIIMSEVAKVGESK